MKLLFNRPRLSGAPKRRAGQNAAEGKPLSLLDDGVFKAVLASDNEDSREALRLLLCACIRREVSAVKVLNSELIPAHLAAKTVRLDVNVTFNDGEVADLEMQAGKSDDDLKKRATLYSSALTYGQSKRGKSYREIKRVYQIFFLNCVLFPDSDKVPQRFAFREEERGTLLNDETEIIFYELPKLEQRVRDYFAGKAGTEALREDEKWCIYMRYRHEEQAEPLIKELCRKEEGIMHAEKALAKVDRDFIRFIRSMNIMKNSMDRASLLYDGGVEEGLAKGLAEGEAKGKAEANLAIARKMKAMGESVEKIQALTGLDPQDIEKLK